MHWRVRHDRPSSPPTVEPAFRSFTLRRTPTLQRVRAGVKTSNRKTRKLAVIGTTGRRLDRQPFRCVKPKCRCVEKFLWITHLAAIYSVLTIAEHFRPTLRDPLTS